MLLTPSMDTPPAAGAIKYRRRCSVSTPKMERKSSTSNGDTFLNRFQRRGNAGMMPEIIVGYGSAKPKRDDTMLIPTSVCLMCWLLW
jgi:hypothetical protein